MTIKEQYWVDGNILVTRGNVNGEFREYYKVIGNEAVGVNLFNGTAIDKDDYDDDLNFKHPHRRSWDIVDVYTGKIAIK